MAAIWARVTLEFKDKNDLGDAGFTELENQYVEFMDKLELLVKSSTPTGFKISIEED